MSLGGCPLLTTVYALYLRKLIVDVTSNVSSQDDLVIEFGLSPCSAILLLSLDYLLALHHTDVLQATGYLISLSVGFLS